MGETNGTSFNCFVLFIHIFEVRRQTFSFSMLHFSLVVSICFCGVHHSPPRKSFLLAISPSFPVVANHWRPAAVLSGEKRSEEEEGEEERVEKEKQLVS